MGVSPCRNRGEGGYGPPLNVPKQVGCRPFSGGGVYVIPAIPGTVRRIFAQPLS